MREMVFISAEFFNLETYIKEAFQEVGFDVTYFNERPSSNALVKVILRTCPGLLRRRMNEYYRSILDYSKDKDIEILFVIKAENLPLWFIKKFKENHPNAKLGLYMYDPIKNYPNILEKSKLFTTCFTFDSEDAKEFNWHHRALFFPPLVEKIGREKSKELYTGSFVGTLHTDRFKVMDAIKTNLPETIKRNLLIFYYVPLLPMFWYGKYITKNYARLNQKEISTKPMSALDTLRAMNNSNFVIDIHHDNQSGLTTRTLEAIGMQKKIITTNPYIMDYDFYSPENVCVIDKYNIIIDEDWFAREYNPNLGYDREKYTVKGFVLEILDKIVEG